MSNESVVGVRGHRLLTDPPTAYGVALALADTFRPGRYITRDGNYDVLDTALVRGDIATVSTGEGVVLGVIASLAGDAPCDLSRLDAVDRAGRRLIAEALACMLPDHYQSDAHR